MWLDALLQAKNVLKEHIQVEITDLRSGYEPLLRELGELVKLVLSTAHAYAKFICKSSNSAAVRILREMDVDVAISDEAQAYEIDVGACLSGGGCRPPFRRRPGGTSRHAGAV
jgi:hypothetical protein